MPDFEEAMNYLTTGGLSEVSALAHLAMAMKREKVQLDADMAIALCALAEEGLKLMAEKARADAKAN